VILGRAGLFSIRENTWMWESLFVVAHNSCEGVT
jgi:hypothetical protein